MTGRRRLGPLRVAWILAAALPSAIALAHPPSILSEREEKATVEEVMAFRKAVAAVIEKKNAAALRKIYADGLQHTHASGKVYSKDAYIAAVLAGEPVIDNAPVSDLTIRVPGGWTAVATGRSPLSAGAHGKSFDVRWTAVYVRVGDGWQIAASQVTRIAEVKP